MSLPIPALPRQMPSGWADDRLMQAYDLIHAVTSDHVTAEDRMPELRALLAQVEQADSALAEVLSSRAS